ncbi:hypothetical protein ILUMI_21984 [Ignelater luminosus]|uniref:Phospholipid/glycerol acyltransferase domain-containing protein n=1 Tax=Ignelater luminosus TaxID=2038154 RepID=A0A8K0G0Y3_IGNLU|nr:hypothetical protein ILUMI_21984 [Ignelater luminosus]
MLSRLNVLKRSRIVHLLFAITFFTSGVIVNLVQCLLYLFLRPFSKHIYRKINWYLCATIYAQLVFMGDWWANINLYLYIDKDDYDKYWGKEHAYCVMNHTYEIDWLLGWMIADRIHLLGNCKAYMKKSLQYMPVLGWAWKFSEFIILERSFEKDKEVINTQIKKLGDHPDPMWLLMFPEGTRFTKEKHKASEEFARERDLPELKYHLQPRTRGFIASVPSMREKVPAVYDILLTFKDDDPVKPTISSLMMGKSVNAHMYMNRIPMEDVPSSEAEQEKFLRDMFVRKDKLRDSFVRTGDFFATSGITRVGPFVKQRRLWPLINITIWMIVILCPMMYYIKMMLFSGKLIYFGIVASILVLFIGLLYKTVGMSKISKGSSYGATNTPKKTN